jgi:hypothetical protein
LTVADAGNARLVSTITRLGRYAEFMANGSSTSASRDVLWMITTTDSRRTRQMRVSFEWSLIHVQFSQERVIKNADYFEHSYCNYDFMFEDSL